MAVDLSDYVSSLKREVNPLGADNYATVSTTDLTGQMSDAFWEARLDGLLVGFTCNADGIITPIPPKGIDPTTLPDLGRDMVQLVILYASFRVIRNTLTAMRTQFKAVAGPVSFEYQQSANLLVELMKDLILRRNIILTRLSDLGSAPAYVIDAINARDEAMRYGETYFVGAGNGPSLIWGV